jgi:multidrug efflux pump subunit AcrB
VKVAEVPPGPPVLQTLVAEIYGPDYQRQIEVARQIRDIFDRADSVVDVDWYVEDDQTKYSFQVDKAMPLNGVATDQVAATMSSARRAGRGSVAPAAREGKECRSPVIAARTARA